MTHLFSSFGCRGREAAHVRALTLTLRAPRRRKLGCLVFRSRRTRHDEVLVVIGARGSLIPGWTSHRPCNLHLFDVSVFVLTVVVVRVYLDVVVVAVHELYDFHRHVG